MNYKILKDFLKKEELNFFKKSLYTEIHSLHKDYYSRMNFNDFFNKMFTTQNRLMRALSYRFLNKNKFIKLKNKINENIFINPLFYVFVINKNFFKSELEKKALLDTQFHYDFPFSLYSNTYWVALDDVNEDTGIGNISIGTGLYCAMVKIDYNSILTY